MCSVGILISFVVDPLKLSEVFPGSTSDVRIKELKVWLATKGVLDLEPVPLNCANIGKVRSPNFASVQVFDIRGRKPSRESRSWPTNCQRDVRR